VLTNVLVVIDMYSGVEDTNRHGGHREGERSENESDRSETTHRGSRGEYLPAPIPPITSQDPSPTPRLDKHGHHERAHIGLNPSLPSLLEMQ